MTHITDFEREVAAKYEAYTDECDCGQEDFSGPCQHCQNNERIRNWMKLHWLSLAGEITMRVKEAEATDGDN